MRSAVRIAFIVTLLLGSASFAQSQPQPFSPKLVAAAMERLNHDVTYDGKYFSIAYPGGDVPSNTGVCTDVIVRSYRSVGIDLQRLVHEDMKANFGLYPDLWGLGRPDTNIDHRRVPNLQVFFAHKGRALSKSPSANDYSPGDLVTWMLPGNLPHIGIVVAKRTFDGQRPLVVHNIGSGPEISDTLFEFPITGHYRYDGRD